MPRRTVDMEAISRRKSSVPEQKRIGQKWPKKRTTKSIIKVGERDFPPYGG